MIKESLYLFFLYFESLYYKYLVCQIFDEKSDFLNYEFSILLPAITQFTSKERVGSREDVTSSNQTSQQPDGIIFSKASVDKNTRRRIKYEPRTTLLHSKVATFVLMSWLDDVISLDPTLFWTLPFLEVSNGRQSYQEFVVQKVGLLIKIMA